MIRRIAAPALAVPNVKAVEQRVENGILNFCGSNFDVCALYQSLLLIFEIKHGFKY